jgi:TatD DNase family protein
MTHPRCVGWGEIGLDYHYDNSPRDIQQSIFTRQLRNAVKLGKPITIHTREAEEDTESILKEEVPKDHKVVHSSMLLRGSIIYLFFLT